MAETINDRSPATLEILGELLGYVEVTRNRINQHLRNADRSRPNELVDSILASAGATPPALRWAAFM